MKKVRVPRHAVIQRLDQSYRLIPLTQGQTAIVDASDYEWLNQWNWAATYSKFTKSFYAYRNIRYTDGTRRMQYMARVILNYSSEFVDHKNHNTLDNRRSNLRPANAQQNQQNQELRPDNTSGYKGVSWRKSQGTWCAQIRINKKPVHLGYFATPEAAAKAYEEAAKKHFGEFAYIPSAFAAITPSKEGGK